MYLRLKIENLSDGKYPLLGDDLSFNAEDVDIDRMLDDPNSIADNTIDFIISKKRIFSQYNRLMYRFFIKNTARTRKEKSVSIVENFALWW